MCVFGAPLIHLLQKLTPKISRSRRGLRWGLGGDGGSGELASHIQQTVNCSDTPSFQTNPLPSHGHDTILVMWTFW